MVNVLIESKKLVLELKEKEDEYIKGNLDLNETLHKTQKLYHQTLTVKDEPVTANKVLYDSNLMKLQTGLARQRAKYYKPDSLVFNPTVFSTTLVKFCQSLNSQGKDNAAERLEEMLWMKMGDYAKKLLYTVPSFSYLNGTFDPDPVTIVRKKRKMREKDKIGKATKPETMSLNENKDKKDITISEAERILSVLAKLCRKSTENLVSYFEFVIDPSSFSRTVENIFIVSLLAKEGCISIVKDKKGLPYLHYMNRNEKIEQNPSVMKQCIISISKKEWQEIVQTFNFKNPLIPPRKAIKYSEDNS